MMILPSRATDRLRILGAALFLAVFMAGCEDSQGGETLLASDLEFSGQGDLSGLWVLNVEESDLPARRRRMQDGTRGETGEGRHGMHRGTGRRGDQDGEGPRQRRMGRGVLEISQTGDEITIGTPSGRSMTLYTDGRTITKERNGREVTIIATWNGEELVIERTVSNGTALTESYSVSADRQQLYVDMRIESDRLDEPQEFRRVYDAEAAS